MGARPPTRFTWESLVATAAVLAAAAAVWMTLRAGFLAHPGWLAVQKADLIVGPVFCGLYWRRRRPHSRFGALLIAVGGVMAVYLLQSSGSAWAFPLGVFWEAPVYLATMVMILAFPTGRLEGAITWMVIGLGLVGTALTAEIVALLPRVPPDGSISGCRAACPSNVFFVGADPSLAHALVQANRAIIVVNAVATIGLLVSRFARGTPPRRRALAVGTPIALCFLLTQLLYHGGNLISAGSGPFHSFAQWSLVGTRAALWYGFLLALVMAELFAARVLRVIVEESLRRPSLGELEAMLRGPLGDPALRLGFETADGWIDGRQARLELPDTASGRMLTLIARGDRPAVVVVHDAQLADDPELVQAAGAVARLAQENAELEAGWNDSLRQLRESRARIAAARDAERRTLERNLHDGAQQQLTALLVKLAMARELLAAGSAVSEQLAVLELELEQSLDELRRLAHGIYPAPLAESGLVGALESVARRSAGWVEVTSEGIGRYSPEVESAVYYCCLEALHNATKHGGPEVHVVIRLHAGGGALGFEVRDNGPGFDPAAAHDGVGLRNLRDRLDAFGGRLEVTSSSGAGTVITGSVPVA